MSGKTQWLNGGGFAWSPVGATVPVLKPDVYAINRTPVGYFLKPNKFVHDQIISIHIARYLSDAIARFRDSRESYKRLGYVHKRGFLMAGPPGTGKSMAAQMVCEEEVGKGAVALIATDPITTSVALQDIRQVHPDLPLTVLWEDIDEWANTDADSNYRRWLTNLFDGVEQIHNVVHIATTNAIEEMDEAFTNRPGRFDDVLWVGPPSYADRLAYLEVLAPAEPKEKKMELAKATESFMLAHLKDMLVSVFILGYEVKDVVKRMEAMRAGAAEAKDAKKGKKARLAYTQV